GDLRAAQIDLPEDGPRLGGSRCLSARASGRDAGAVEETVLDSRRQGAGGRLRADPQVDAAFAGDGARCAREWRALQYRRRPVEGGGQAQVIRRALYG